MVFHGWHPNSPLSHPALTKAVFFSRDVSDSYVLGFQRQICSYESFLWPVGMLGPFANPRTVVQQISGWGRHPRLLIMAGTEDRLMTPPVMQELAATYRDAFRQLASEKMTEAQGSESVKEEALGNSGQGVRLCLVRGAGHHLQNDIQWEDGAGQLFEFYNQL